MGFKFTFLGLEFNNCDSDNTKSNSHKISNQQEKFKEAVDTCHRKTKDRKAFGKCMSKELKS